MDDISYGSNSGGSPMGFKTFPGYVELDPIVWKRFHKIGELSVSVLKKIGRLLSEICNGQRPDLEWILQIFLGSVPRGMESLARELIVKVGDRCPVGFFRADVVGNWEIAELQCPGSGLAYNAALEIFYGATPESSAVFQALRARIANKRATWWLQNPAFERSVTWMVKECRNLGMDIELVDATSFDPDKVECVLKRPALPDLLAHPKGVRLLERWLHGAVELDTLPTMAVEVKHWLPLLIHPATRELFTAEERGLAPPSYFVDSPETRIVFPNGQRPERTIAETFTRYCNAILKYGGGEKSKRAGCHAVYYLGSVGCKLPEREKHMATALADYQAHEAWILQQYKPAFVRRPDKDERADPYYAVYRPHYVVQPTGQSSLVSVPIAARSDWKVHGRRDAYFGLCR